MDPIERSMQMRLAAHVSWANTSDRQARTEKARKAWNDRFEKQVDPDGVLPEAERRQRAESARKAFYAEMSLRSVQARRIKKQLAEEAKRKKADREVAAYQARKGKPSASAA